MLSDLLTPRSLLTNQRPVSWSCDRFSQSEASILTPRSLAVAALSQSLAWSYISWRYISGHFSPESFITNCGVLMAFIYISNGPAIIEKFDHSGARVTIFSSNVSRWRHGWWRGRKLVDSSRSGRDLDSSAASAARLARTGAETTSGDCKELLSLARRGWSAWVDSLTKLREKKDIVG